MGVLSRPGVRQIHPPARSRAGVGLTEWGRGRKMSTECLLHD